MRHRSASHNFSRHPDHRRAMLRNLVMNLFQHGRIRTTIQKAKAARPVAEKLITLGKKGSIHHRQLALRELGSTVAAKAAVRVLFGPLSQRFAARNGGYTRILHLPRTIRQAKVDLPRSQGIARSKLYGTRLRDNAELVLWELCEAEIRKPERPSRRPKSKKPNPRLGKEPKPAEAASGAKTEAKADGGAEEKKA
jgi:large subunit ribosomal protein L17